MEIKSIAVSKLVPAPYNPRVELRPGDAEYERLRRSLDEFGCVEPLVWNRRTPKPLAVFEIPMAQHTLPGEVCYEPFAGSGSQLIAAQRLGRRCLAMEISPRYCDVIVRRYLATAHATGAKVDRALAARYAAPDRTQPATRSAAAMPRAASRKARP